MFRYLELFIKAEFSLNISSINVNFTINGSDPYLIADHFQKNYKKVIKSLPKNVQQIVVDRNSMHFHSM